MTMSPKPPVDRLPNVGGQAVIEGVMMRSPRAFAVVVRRKSGALTLRERSTPDSRRGILAWPLVRGVVTLVDSLRLGSQALRFSAEHYEADLEAEHIASGRAIKPAAKPVEPGVVSTLTHSLVALSVSNLEPTPAVPARQGKSLITWLAIIFALVLFVAMPQAVTASVSNWFDMKLDIRSPGFQLLTGMFKLLIVVGYMVVIRRMPEIRRVFQFHGAEHKAIATFEAGEALTVENARGKPRLHPRCGTTFLVMVVLVSILVFTVIGPFLPRFAAGQVGENVLFFFMKLPFLPVIAAITYELQRVSARYFLRGPLRLALAPGFAVQRITTIEPDDEQLEVALASLRVALAEPAEGPPETRDKSYGSYRDLLNAPAYRALGDPASS